MKMQLNWTGTNEIAVFKWVSPTNAIAWSVEVGQIRSLDSAGGAWTNEIIVCLRETNETAVC